MADRPRTIAEAILALGLPGDLAWLPVDAAEERLCYCNGPDERFTVARLVRNERGWQLVEVTSDRRRWRVIAHYGRADRAPIDWAGEVVADSQGATVTGCCYSPMPRDECAIHGRDRRLLLALPPAPPVVIAMPNGDQWVPPARAWWQSWACIPCALASGYARIRALPIDFLEYRRVFGPEPIYYNDRCEILPVGGDRGR